MSTDELKHVVGGQSQGVIGEQNPTTQ